jgi:predicted SnoaL-like aldol condensation-catalyzing enzyme
MRKICGLLFALIISSPALAQLPVKTVTDQQALLKSSDPKLAANKKLVFDFWTEVFQTRDMTKAPVYMREDYMQHNPIAATGRAPFMKIFGSFPKQPKKNTIDDLVSLVAEGDLVVLAFKRECKNVDKPGETYTTTWFDMLRIEDGKIAEHWDYGTLAGKGNPADCAQ